MSIYLLTDRPFELGVYTVLDNGMEQGTIKSANSPAYNATEYSICLLLWRQGFAAMMLLPVGIAVIAIAVIATVVVVASCCRWHSRRHHHSCRHHRCYHSSRHRHSRRRYTVVVVAVIAIIAVVVATVVVTQSSPSPLLPSQSSP